MVSGMRSGSFGRHLILYHTLETDGWPIPSITRKPIKTQDPIQYTNICELRKQS